jgi:hypothetical protein
MIHPVLHDDCALLFHFLPSSHHTDVTWPEFLQSWKILMFVHPQKKTGVISIQLLS